MIISHLDGAISYLIEPIKNCFQAYPECTVYIQDFPKHCLKKIYLDTVSFRQSLACACGFRGGNRVAYREAIFFGAPINTVWKGGISDEESEGLA